MIRMHLSGDLDIARNVFLPGGRVAYLIKEIVVCLKIVFRRLGHNVRVYSTTNFVSRVRSDHGDIGEEQDIMQMTNVIYSAFCEADYDVNKTLESLEKIGLIPCIGNELDT